MKLRTILVSFILAVPLAVFIFLYLFGENRFEVLPLHQEAGGEIPCGEKVEFPFYSPIINDLSYGDELTLLAFISDTSVSDKSAIQFARICEKLEKQNVKYQLFCQSELVDGVSCFPVNILPDSLFLQRRNCGFLLPEATDLVLIDSKRRIRGYYKSNDREEIDRLAVEVEIISINEYE